MRAIQYECKGCGRKQIIELSEAGLPFVCACGYENRLPPLSDLRRQAGMIAFEKPAAEAIFESVEDGRLPSNDMCVGCRIPQANKRWLVAICERGGAQARTVGGNDGQFIAGIASGIPFVLPIGGPSGGEIVEGAAGRDVTVPLPVHICDNCWPRLLRSFPAVICRAALWALLVAAGALLLLWVIAPLGGWFTLSFKWVMVALSAALIAWLAGLRLARRDEEALKSSLRIEPLYDLLFTDYPDAQIVEEEPAEANCRVKQNST